MIFTSLHKIIYKVFGIHKVFASQMIRRPDVYFFNPDDVFKFVFIICSPNIERAFFQQNPKRRKQQPLNCGKCYQRLKLTVILEGNFLNKYTIFFPILPKANRLSACRSLMMFTEILESQKSNFLKMSRTERVKSRLLKKKLVSECSYYETMLKLR